MDLRRTAIVIFLLGMSRLATAQEGSPAGSVPAERLTARRALLLDRIGEGVAVIQGARVHDMEGEDFPQASDFRQDDDFFYLTGLETPGAILVLIAHNGAPDRQILFIAGRNEAEEQWTGARLGAREAATQSGIADVRTLEEAPAFIAAATRATKNVFAKVPRDVNPTWSSAVEAQDLREQMGALRLVKDDEELRRLRRAIEITGDAIRVAMQHSKPGDFEYVIEARIEQVFHASGAERVGFPSIVGSGPNTTTLHYDKSRRRTQAGDLVVMDLGAEFGYYTADVSRTMPISGKFTPRQRAIYDLVLATQQVAIDSVRPGMTLPRLDDIARNFMRDHSGRLCGDKSCDEYFVHAIGHWLGMDVHDPGNIAAPFQAGMVLAVEPGIYLPKEAIGVRIEDDVLVTATGCEVLSKNAPKRIDEIERLMSGGL